MFLNDRDEVILFSIGSCEVVLPPAGMGNTELTCGRPVEPPGTGSEPPPLPNADAALWGGVCRRRV